MNSPLGLSGLPSDWEVLLKSANIPKDQVANDLNGTIGVLKFITEGGLESQSNYNKMCI